MSKGGEESPIILPSVRITVNIFTHISHTLRTRWADDFIICYFYLTTCCEYFPSLIIAY